MISIEIEFVSKSRHKLQSNDMMIIVMRCPWPITICYIALSFQSIQVIKVGSTNDYMLVKHTEQGVPVKRVKLLILRFFFAADHNRLIMKRYRPSARIILCQIRRQMQRDGTKADRL